MIDPIAEKIKEFVDRMESEDMATLIPEVVTYLEGTRDNEPDPTKRELTSGLMLSLGLAKSIITIAKKVKERNDETKSELNSQLEKIIRLEKRLDGMVKGK